MSKTVTELEVDDLYEKMGINDDFIAGVIRDVTLARAWVSFDQTRLSLMSSQQDLKYKIALLRKIEQLEAVISQLNSRLGQCGIPYPPAELKPGQVLWEENPHKPKPKNPIDVSVQPINFGRETNVFVTRLSAGNYYYLAGPGDFANTWVRQVKSEDVKPFITCPKAIAVAIGKALVDVYGG